MRPKQTLSEFIIMASSNLEWPKRINIMIRFLNILTSLPNGSMVSFSALSQLTYSDCIRQLLMLQKWKREQSHFVLP